MCIKAFVFQWIFVQMEICRFRRKGNRLLCLLSKWIKPVKYEYSHFVNWYKICYRFLVSFTVGLFSHSMDFMIRHLKIWIFLLCGRNERESNEATNSPAQCALFMRICFIERGKKPTTRRWLYGILLIFMSHLIGTVFCLLCIVQFQVRQCARLYYLRSYKLLFSLVNDNNTAWLSSAVFFF